MTDPVTIWTYDWVPPGPRGPVGFVRDIRLRWAMEEMGLPYRVATVPLRDKGPDHLARQPFGQVPFLDDGPLRIFESSACLLHLAEKSPILLPREPDRRADALQWFFAALNSMEMVTVPRWFIDLKAPETNPLAGWMTARFDRLEPVLAGRDWLAAGQFSLADIMMADVLRMPLQKGHLAGHPAIAAYVARATARPAFQKALADQQAHFAAAEAARG